MGKVSPLLAAFFSSVIHQPFQHEIRRDLAMQHDMGRYEGVSLYDLSCGFDGHYYIPSGRKKTLAESSRHASRTLLFKEARMPPDFHENVLGAYTYWADSEGQLQTQRKVILQMPQPFHS